MCSIILSANSDNFTSFQFGFVFFLFLLLSLPKLRCIIVAIVDIFALLLILEEMISVFHHWEWYLLWVYHKWPLLYWGRFPLLSTFYLFYHKLLVNFVKSFVSCIYWDDHMVFILQFVDVVYHTDWFADVEESLHPWDESCLIMAYELFSVSLDTNC